MQFVGSKTSHRLPSPLALLVAASCLAASPLTLSCAGDFTHEDNGGFGGGPSGSPDGGPITAGSEAGRTYFRANIQPLMSSPRPLQPCALCHQGTNTANGPNFLGLNADENYEGIISAGLLGTTPLESRLYTRGLHAGDAFTAAESDLVAEWIRIEATDAP